MGANFWKRIAAFGALLFALSWWNATAARWVAFGTIAAIVLTNPGVLTKLFE